MTAHAFLKLMILIVLLGAGAIAVFFRQEQEGIRRYTVHRPKPAARMLGAIIPREDEAWFFKLTGPNDAVAEQSKAFRELIQSVTFSSEPVSEPNWKLPAGWTLQPGSQMRFATLAVEHDGENLECSVTVLPTAGGILTSYLLANINRWRDQLRVPRISVEDLDSHTTTVKLSEAGLTATLVEFAGELSAAGMGQAPFAGSAAGSPRPQPSAPAASDEKLSYDVPEGWKPGQLEVSRGGITVRRAAAFLVGDGKQGAEITVTKLSFGSIEANVNRWRGQIGLDSISAEQLEQAKKQLEFAGAPADYVQFVGEQEAILGVIAVRGSDVWFVKLQGSADLAAREREHFEEFVKSIRF